VARPFGIAAGGPRRRALIARAIVEIGHPPRPEVGRGPEITRLPPLWPRKVVEGERVELPVLRLMAKQTLHPNRSVEVSGEEDALEPDPIRPELLRGDPFLHRLVSVDVVDARIPRVAGAEALHLDEAVVHEEAPGEAPDGGEPALAQILGVGQRGRAQGQDE